MTVPYDRRLVPNTTSVPESFRAVNKTLQRRYDLNDTGKEALFVRVDPSTKAAMTATARRLGMSAAAYAEEAIAKAIRADANRVAEAESAYRATVEQIS